MNKNYLSLFILIFLGFTSCTSKETNPTEDLTKVLEQHLSAISEKNMSKLLSTLPPDSSFLFILPNSLPTTHSRDFIEFHQNWFKDTTWTFETKILEKNVEENLGIALVEVLYKEPNRNGKPYFNRMSVTYALKKINSKWYVIKDHASSIEKSKY